MENNNEVIEKKDILKVEDLSKSYGKRTIINNISFTIKEGECYCLFGKNGIGKSTTLDCVLGIKKKDSGTILLDDINLDEDPLEFKKHIGYVPSEPTLYEMMTGNEYLDFMASIYDLSDSTFKGNKEALANRFVMNEEDLNRRIDEYSHGMKQKVSLIASLLHNPDLWILDEPTVGLDPMVLRSLENVINDLKAHNKSMLIVSHSVDFILNVANKASLINSTSIESTFDIKANNPYLKKDMERLFEKLYEGKGKKE